MKRISFIAITLLIMTGCKNEPKQPTHEPEPIKKDSHIVKAPTEENKVDTESNMLPTLKECTERTVEYGSEQECIFPKSTLEEVYQKTIKEKEVEMAELLLTELPRQSTEKEINQDGLDIISYKVTPKKIEIELQFAGGVTTLELEQQSENVKRTIIHSAD